MSADGDEDAHQQLAELKETLRQAKKLGATPIFGGIDLPEDADHSKYGERIVVFSRASQSFFSESNKFNGERVFKELLEDMIEHRGVLVRLDCLERSTN
jgi:hypothetical protein